MDFCALLRRDLLISSRSEPVWDKYFGKISNRIIIMDTSFEENTQRKFPRMVTICVLSWSPLFDTSYWFFTYNILDEARYCNFMHGGKEILMRRTRLKKFLSRPGVLNRLFPLLQKGNSIRTVSYAHLRLKDFLHTNYFLKIRTLEARTVRMFNIKTTQVYSC